MNKLCLNLLMGASLALLACGAKSDTEANDSLNSAVSQTKSVQEVTLTSRYTGGDYITATYSFRHLTRDNVNKTFNNWELLFEAREDFADHFDVNTVVDDNSFIYDLGKRNCKDIKSSVPSDRKSRPMVWLAYSDASPNDLEPTKSALVKKGHCYLTYNSDEDGRVIALFHVKDHKVNKSVTIDQIEVLDDVRVR